MIRIFKTLVAHTWLLFLLLVILGGILITLARLVTPVISDYRTEMAQWASETLGYPVSIGKISARWSGLGPQLVLQDVTLIDPESSRPALEISQIRIAINLADSLSSWKISPRRITVVGATLLIKRRIDGSITISGLEALNGKADTSSAFLLHGRVSLKQCEVYWKNEAIAGNPIHFSDVDLDLINAGARHRIKGSVTLPPASGQGIGGSFQLAADLHISEGNPGNLSGRIYAKGSNLPLVRLVKGRIPKQFLLTGGLADMELWSYWKKGMPTRFEGGLRLSGLRLATLSDSVEDPGRALESDLIEGRFRWQQSDHGWRFDLKDLAFSRRGLSWPVSEVSLLTRYDAEGRRHFRAGADFLRLEDIHAIVGLLPDLAPGLQQVLRKIRPQADIHRLKLIYNEGEGNGPRWSASGKVDPLFTRAWQKIPAVNNLSFQFWLDQGQGSILLETRQANIDLPRLFRDPLPLDRLQGLLSWRKIPAGGWRIDSNTLLAENSDIQTSSRLRLEFPAQADASIFMDLRTDFVNGDGSTVPRYLPVGIMKPNLIDWLDRAIVKGEVISGSCILNGPLKHFPFNKTQDGHFEVRFKARDVTLDYGPGWPRAENISAKVRFLNNSFELWASEGRIFKTGIRKAHAGIESLRPTSPLVISIQSDGPVHDQLRFLAKSPLKTQFAPLVKNLSGSGDAGLKLALTLPLKKQHGKISLDGRIRMNGAGLNLIAWQLPVTDIRGDLLFDQAHLQAKGVKGRILGGKGSVDISTPTENGQVTRLSASGTVTTEALNKRFPESGLEHFRGSTGWHMQLDIPHRLDATLPLEIGSNLEGIGINLPAPLGKEPGQVRKLLVTADLRGDEQTPLQARYGDILDASLLLGPGEPDKSRLTGANLQLGGGIARPARPQRLELRGHLQQLQLDPWLAQAKNRHSDSSLPPLEAVDLRVDLVLLGERRVENSHLSLEGFPNAWSGRISSDNFAGDIRIPKDLEQKAIEINLQRLALTYEAEDESAATEASEPIRIDPGDIPSFHLTAEQMKINDHPFGTLEILTQSKPQGLALKMLSLDSPQLQLSASGSWTRNEWFQQTQLDINLKSNSFGQLLSNLGIWSNLMMAPADIVSRLHWNGPPHPFDPANLNGNVSLRFGKGQLLEVKPGLGRLLGLLNIGSLQRRLKLDFNDMTVKGFAFDKIEGDFKLEEGDARTTNLTIEGPAANIDISGRFGLGKKDLDQDIRVTPSISSALSLAGFAAGPQVGVAMVLAQRLVGEQVDRASGSQYRVTGPWNEMKVVRKADAVKDSIMKLDPPEHSGQGVLQAPLTGD